MLVFYNISFSWLLPLHGFQVIFLLRDSENDLQLIEMTFGLVHASYSLPKWQAVKLTFFAPCMIHFPFLLLFLTLKYTLHNVTPYSLSLLNFNVRIHLVHTYIAAVSNHMYITSKFSSNGSHHHMFNDALEDQFTWVKHHNVYTYFVSHQVKQHYFVYFRYISPKKMNPRSL